MAEEIKQNEIEQPVASEQLSFVDEKVRFKLDNFEGPLDLLLHLIKDAKLDIMTVKLSEITEQYLEYMQDLDSIDMDRASEFITVAATLIEIKSKHLLPVEQDDELVKYMKKHDVKVVPAYYHLDSGKVDFLDAN